jgi:pimeloyl-ACP methyl ester carboxylesterase
VKTDLKSGPIGYLDRGSGPVVLLIHAFPLNREMWEPQLDVLANRFRVIAPDVRGFGESQPASPWTMEEAADDMIGLLDHIEATDAAVVGVSMGGYIELALWQKYPSRIRRLVLSNSRARADSDTEKAARNEMIAAIHHSGTTVLPDRMLPRLLQPNSPPGVVATVRRMIADSSGEAAAYAVMALRDRMDFSSMLHRMTCPALVVAGTNDAIIRLEESRAVAENIPGGQFVEIPNSGHLSNLENPEAYNAALLSFLSSK